VRTIDGQKVIQHGGGIEGFNAQLAYYPEDKLTVIVLGNLNGSAPKSIALKLAGVAQGKTVMLQTERKEVSVSARALAHCAGVYELAPGMDMLITVENNQLISQLTHQGPAPLFAESETKFFPKVVDAELEFSGNDAEGKAAELTLFQNGRQIKGKPVDDPRAKQVTDAMASTNKRFKDQSAAPGSEQALRRMIEELRAGKPNYDLMSPGLATATRQQLPQLQSMLTEMGAVQDVTFKGVGPPWNTEFGSGWTGKSKARMCAGSRVRAAVLVVEASTYRSTRMTDPRKDPAVTCAREDCRSRSGRTIRARPQCCLSVLTIRV